MLKLFKKKHNTATDDTAPKIPNHIAFICDGNRRWAEARGLPPLAGHRAGIANFENLVDWFIARGVTTITFFFIFNRKLEPIPRRSRLFNGFVLYRTGQKYETCAGKKSALSGNWFT